MCINAFSGWYVEEPVTELIVFECGFDVSGNCFFSCDVMEWVIRVGPCCYEYLCSSYGE